VAKVRDWAAEAAVIIIAGLLFLRWVQLKLSQLVRVALQKLQTVLAT
jgi:hypothetical protein